jgi:hypothetical protein
MDKQWMRLTGKFGVKHLLDLSKVIVISQDNKDLVFKFENGFEYAVYISERDFVTNLFDLLASIKGVE